MSDDRTPAREAVLAVRALDRALSRLEQTTDAATDELDDAQAAAVVAVLQNVRKRLGAVEAPYATTLGQRHGRHVGTLPDGRQYTLERYPDRKEWDHESWKHDARREVVKAVLAKNGLPSMVEVLSLEGEVDTLPLAELLQVAVTAAQEVHGSTAPRSGQLKALGLFTTDYATSTPGGWKFAAVQPTETKP